MKKIAIVTVTALSLIMGSSNALQVSAAETKKSYEQLQKEKKSKTTEKNQVKEEAKKLYEEMKSYGQKADEYNKQLNEQAAQIAQNEQKLLEQKKKLNNLMANMYENNMLSPVKHLLSSKDLSQFIERFEGIQMLLGVQYDVVSEYQQTLDQIKKQKVAIEKVKAEQDVVLQDLRTKYTALEEKLKQLDKDIDFIEEASEKIELSEQARKQIGSYDGIAKGTGQFGWPLSIRGTITSQLGDGRGHDGIDIAAPSMTPVLAADDGIVAYVRFDDGGYGHYLVINHGNGLSTLYAHMPSSSIRVKPGQSVRKGQQIGGVGRTGRSYGATGYHLHFEVRINNNPVNPLKYL